MAIEKVREYFESFGAAARIREFDVSSATVSLAAQALGCEEAHIAKTLAFFTPQGPALIVAAGDAKVDNAKFKAQFGVKAKMIPPQDVQALVGHAPGGVCPFCVNAGVQVFLDCSLQRFATIYPAAGSANSAVPPCRIAFAAMLKLPGHMMPTERPQRAQPTRPNTGQGESDASR